MLPHICVISHERSGTHVAIDSIRNNFKPYGRNYYVNIDRMVPGHPNETEPAHIQELLDRGPRVIKTHAVPDLKTFYRGRAEAVKVAQQLFEESKCIYVYRNPKDVLLSLYQFYWRNKQNFNDIPFSTFLKETTESDIARNAFEMDPITYWRNHVENWLDKEDVLSLSFDGMLKFYTASLEQIADFIEQPLPHQLCNVLRESESNFGRFLSENLFKLVKRKLSGLELTSVDFGPKSAQKSGVQFSVEDSTYLNSVAGELISKLGYS